jgi:hypothetical protein
VTTAEVAKYLVESYMPRAGADAVSDAASRARLAAEELSRAGTPVRYLRSIFIPEDEICFFLFDGPSQRAIGEASRRAAIDFERVLAADERGIG